MIITIIGIILLLSAMSDIAEASDWETSERNADIRHKEFLAQQRKAEKKHQELLEAYMKQNRISKVKRKRTAVDCNGNTLIEEIEVEGDFNYEQC